MKSPVEAILLSVGIFISEIVRLFSGPLEGPGPKDMLSKDHPPGF